MLNKFISTHSSILIGFIVISLLFIFTFNLRLPYLNRPLGGQHEWVTTHALISIENMQKYPISKHLFRLISTYPLTTNYHVTDWVIVRLMDPNGVGYYTTHPPFGVILPYIVFSVLKLKVSIISIQIFNIIMHFIATIFLFLTIYHTTNKHKFLASMTTSVVYIFSASSLWFFSSTYSWDTLWYQLLVIDIFFISYLITHTKNDKAYSIACTGSGIATTLMIYTDLYGIFFVTSTILLLFLNNHHQRITISKHLIVASVFPILTYVLQNCTISGFKAFVDVMLFKFSYYSSLSQQAITKTVYVSALARYQFLLIPSLLLLTLQLLITIMSKRKLKIFNKTQFILFLIPVTIALQLVMFFFTHIVIHEFASLIAVTTIAYGIGYCIGNVQAHNRFARIVLTLIISISLWFFARHSMEDYKIYAGEKPNLRHYNLAQNINRDLNPDEVLFVITDSFIPPQITYFTKRNFAVIKNEQEARNILTTIHMKKGKIFWINDSKKIINSMQINLN